MASKKRKVTICEAFDITKKRADELHRLVEKALASKKTKTWTDSMIMIKKGCRNESELMFAIFHLGAFASKSEFMFRLARTVKIMGALEKVL